MDDGARILDGKAIASEMLAETARDLEAFRAEHGTTPSIVVVIVGSDPASEVYARRILKTAERIGADGRIVELPEATDEAQLRAALRGLSVDEAVTGIILQLPLPKPLDVRHVVEALDPLKDLDGIHPFNAGLVSRGATGFAPSCAEAALVILKRSGVPIAGRPTVVIGRSNVVGRPAQLLLIAEDATVTVCHRRTRDVPKELGRAEVVVVAAGSPGLVDGRDIRPGAVVVDCGINVRADGSIVGDVDLPSVLQVAGAVTPVPGGVGPVTNAVLMQHLMRAARAQAAGGFPDAIAVGAGS